MGMTTRETESTTSLETSPRIMMAAPAREHKERPLKFIHHPYSTHEPCVRTSHKTCCTKETSKHTFQPVKRVWCWTTTCRSRKGDQGNVTPPPPPRVARTGGRATNCQAYEIRPAWFRCTLAYDAAPPSGQGSSKSVRNKNKKKISGRKRPTA